MPTPDERIAALERELAELKAKTDRPLTVAEIRKLSPEEAQKRWEHIKRSLRDDRDDRDDRDADRDGDGEQRRGGRREKLSPRDKISRGLAEAARQRAAEEDDR